MPLSNTPNSENHAVNTPLGEQKSAKFEKSRLDRVRAQGKKLGRPKVPAKVEEAIRVHLSAGYGILKVAATVGVGSGTVQRVKREMVGELRAAT